MKTSLVLLLSAAAFAQQPVVENGKVEIQPFSGSLSSQLAQLGPGPFWAGYSESSAPGHHNGCFGDGSVNTIRLEGDTAIAVLVRIEGGQVVQLRVASPDCKLDAGGLRFVWIDKVPPAASIAWLKQQVSGAHPDRAISAIALHANTDANRTLLDMARNDKSPRVRGQALFWLAQSAANKQAAEVINNAALNDPDRQVKERAVFALSQLPPDQGVPLLIGLAKSNSDPNVRKKAVFWLGQSKDPRAMEFFSQVLSR